MEKFVLQWEGTFPVNVPQLVPTEQNTIQKKENVNGLCFEMVCQEQFCFVLILCFCRSLGVLNWLAFTFNIRSSHSL